MFSNAAQYALRAGAYLGSVDSESYVPARKVAEALQIPPTFLAKVLKQLVDAGLLLAYRGPTGGVRLSRGSDKITVREVLEAIDGDGLFTQCILGLPGCGDRTPCPMHDAWAIQRRALAEQFDRQTLAELADAYAHGELRLAP